MRVPQSAPVAETDARRLPRSRWVHKLLALEVGGTFTAPVENRATLAGHASKWGPRRGRKFRIRRLLRRDGRVTDILIERVA